MVGRTSIEWTDLTWNPSTGCSKVSPGCKNCYAEAFSMRLRRMGLRKYANGFQFAIHPEDLELPLRWKKPRMIFVNSMSDLFHEDMPDSYLKSIFHVMRQADQHIYQVLTKRPHRMLQFVSDYNPVPDNTWMGVTVENADFRNRIDVLREVPCKTRFVSFEPLIGPVGRLDLQEISWVIVGGESGRNHRPIRPEWVREIRDQCLSTKVPFFFKQWGGPRPKSGGRELDGRIWNDYPIDVPETLCEPKRSSAKLGPSAPDSLRRS